MEGRQGRPAASEASRQPLTLPRPAHDTVADIGEKNNLAAANADVVQRLQAAYAAHIAEIKKNRRPTAAMPRKKSSSSAERPNPRKKNPKKKDQKKKNAAAG